VEASGAQLQPKPITTDNLKFGHTYSDHMMEVDWHIEDGWTRPKISPLHNFSMHPGAKVDQLKRKLTKVKNQNHLKQLKSNTTYVSNACFDHNHNYFRYVLRQ
jgi:hypothetical protein